MSLTPATWHFYRTLPSSLEKRRIKYLHSYHSSKYSWSTTFHEFISALWSRELFVQSIPFYFRGVFRISFCDKKGKLFRTQWEQILKRGKGKSLRNENGHEIWDRKRFVDVLLYEDQRKINNKMRDRGRSFPPRLFCLTAHRKEENSECQLFLAVCCCKCDSKFNYNFRLREIFSGSLLGAIRKQFEF